MELRSVRKVVSVQSTRSELCSCNIQPYDWRSCCKVSIVLRLRNSPGRWGGKLLTPLLLRGLWRLSLNRYSPYGLGASLPNLASCTERKIASFSTRTGRTSYPRKRGFSELLKGSPGSLEAPYRR